MRSPLGEMLVGTRVIALAFSSPVGTMGRTVTTVHPISTQDPVQFDSFSAPASVDVPLTVGDGGFQVDGKLRHCEAAVVGIDWGGILGR